MFDPTKDIPSPNKRDKEPLPIDPIIIQERAKQKEAPTPSQMGRFLSALDRSKADRKKETPQSSRGDSFAISEEEDSEESENKGLFGLVGSTKKGRIQSSLMDDDLSMDMSKSSTSQEDESTVELTGGMIQAQSLLKLAAQNTSPNVSKPSLSSIINETQTTLSKSSLTRKEQEEEVISNTTRIPNDSLLAISTQAMMVDDEKAKALLANQSAQRTEMVELINTITAHITTLEAKSLTSVQILIKHPPIFEGATITINEFSSAKRELNLSFSDLSPDARRLIESTANRDLLQHRLTETGYTLRMLTIDSGIRFHESSLPQKDDGSKERSNDSNPDSKNGKRQRFSNEEETVI